MSAMDHHTADSPMGDVVGQGEPPLHNSNVGHQSKTCTMSTCVCGLLAHWQCHAVLVAMGWQPGRGLGERGRGVSQPVTAVIRPRRAGLGVE
jgi:hypothetical protein